MKKLYKGFVWSFKRLNFLTNVAICEISSGALQALF